MKTGKLLTLLTVAIVASVAAIFVYRRDTAIQPGHSSQDQTWRGNKLLTKLIDKAGDIRRIEIEKASEKAVLVRNDEDKWQLETKNGYPADESQVRKLVFDLSELTASDRITENPERYAELGVEGGETGEGSIRALSASGDAIASITLGKIRGANFDSDAEFSRPGGGQYVRVGSDPYVYLSNREVHPNTNLRGWVDGRIATIPAPNVMAVDVDHVSTESVRFASKNERLNLEGPLPRGMRASEWKVDSTRGALANLMLDDVIPAESQEARQLDFTSTSTFQTFDGTIYSVRGAKKDANAGDSEKNAGEKGETLPENARYYIALSARYDAPVFTDEDKASTTSMTKAQEKADQAKKAVPAFNESHAPWVYEISSGDYTQILPNRASLVEPEPTPTPTPQAEAKSGKKNGKK